MILEDFSNIEDIKIIIDGETFEIYSVRGDGKIYFWNVDNIEEQYNSNMEKLHKNLDDGTWVLA